MAKRIAVNRIVVNRNNVNVVINAGEKFDFTAEEIKSLEELGAVTTKETVDVNETGGEGDGGKGGKGGKKDKGGDGAEGEDAL